MNTRPGPGATARAWAKRALGKKGANSSLAGCARAARQKGRSRTRRRFLRQRRLSASGARSPNHTALIMAQRRSQSTVNARYEGDPRPWGQHGQSFQEFDWLDVFGRLAIPLNACARSRSERDETLHRRRREARQHRRLLRPRVGCTALAESTSVGTTCVTRARAACWRTAWTSASSPSDARPREHSAEAAVSQRRGRRTVKRIGGEPEKPRPTASTCVRKLIGLVRPPDCPRFVPGGLKVWLRGRDLNPRPLGYEPNELPDCSTPRQRRPRAPERPAIVARADQHGQTAQRD